MSFLHYSSKLIKESTSRIIEAKAMPNHRERLTWSTTYDEINTALILPCIKVPDICKPIFLLNIIIGKIALLTLWLNIACKHDNMFQTESLKCMFNGSNATENGTNAHSVFGFREFQLLPRNTIRDWCLRNLFLVFQRKRTVLNDTFYFINFL